MRNWAQRFNYFCFFLIAALWGGSFVAIKIVITSLPPIFAACLRVLIAAFTLFITFKILGKDISLKRRPLSQTWVVGLFAITLPFTFLFWAEKFISAGLAGIICASVPIWAFIFSFVLIPKQAYYSTQRFIGLMIGMVGVAIIFWPMVHFSGQRVELIGSFAAIGMSISYGIGALLNQQLLSRHAISIEANITNQLISSGVTLLLLSLIFEKLPTNLHIFCSGRLIFAVFYLAVASTALAWLMYYYLINQWGAVRASAATFVAPGMAVLWDYLIFKDVTSMNEILGITVMLIGVVLLQFAKKQ